MAQTIEKPAELLSEQPSAANKAPVSNSSKQQDARDTATATEAPAAPQQQQEQQQKGRKLLVILHGKRIDDDQVRNAIQVRGTAVVNSRAVQHAPWSDMCNTVVVWVGYITGKG